MAQSAKNFNNQWYNATVVGKNIEVTKPLKDYVDEKLAKLEVMIHQIIDVRVRLDVQKGNHMVDIVTKFSHFKIYVRSNTENMYSAIDKAFERLYAKLRKWKSRIQDHHAKGVAVTEMEVNVLEHIDQEGGEIDREIIDENNHSLEQEFTSPIVVKRKSRPLKMLTLDEAVMKMELSNDHFMIFRSEEEQDLKVIYRRRDGSYGVVSPE